MKFELVFVIVVVVEVDDFFRDFINKVYINVLKKNIRRKEEIFVKIII